MAFACRLAHLSAACSLARLGLRLFVEIDIEEGHNNNFDLRKFVFTVSSLVAGGCIVCFACAAELMMI